MNISAIVTLVTKLTEKYIMVPDIQMGFKVRVEEVFFKEIQSCKFIRHSFLFSFVRN